MSKHPKLNYTTPPAHVPDEQAVMANMAFEFDDRTLSSLVDQNRGTAKLAELLDPGHKVSPQR